MRTLVFMERGFCELEKLVELTMDFSPTEQVPAER